MGLIGNILGLGRAAQGVGEAVGGVAEVFVGNRAKQDEAAFERVNKTLEQYEKEFELKAEGPFDQAVNGLNRLPRPMLALGTLALFGYAMMEPVGFSARMQGLNLVPEPLWWLLGVIVSFYFGAREMHHFRSRNNVSLPLAVAKPARDVMADAHQAGNGENVIADQMSTHGLFRRSGVTDPYHNAAVEEWRSLNT